jgi:ribosome-binding ATPase YchF (GTP1/OBG family)
MKIYKIKNTETGLFSKGGTVEPSWSKKGKTWSSIGHLKVHLANVDHRRCNTDKWEIYEIEVSENTTILPVSAVLNEVAKKAAMKKQKEEDDRLEREMIRFKAINKLTLAERRVLGVGDR